QTLTAPLSGRPCVCYVVSVERRGRTERYWHTIVRESKSVRFQIADETGHAIIDPSSANLVLHRDVNTSSGTFDDATPSEEAFLARHGEASKGWLFNKALRYHESVVEIGETIAVLGSGVREPDPAGVPAEGYRSAPPTRLRLTSSARFPLVISD